MATTRQKFRPTPEEFIEAWQGSSTVRQVAHKLHMKTNQVRVRACRYRQRGIPLKTIPPAELPDWDELAAYAERLAPGASKNPNEIESMAATE